MAHLGDSVDTADVVRSAATRGLRLIDLRAYQVHRREPAHCLVLGYGNLTDAAIDDAVTILAAAVARSPEAQQALLSAPPR